MRLVLVAAAVIVLGAAAQDATAATRVGTTAEGVRIAFDGRTAKVRTAVKGVVQLEVECGPSNPRRSPPEGRRHVRGPGTFTVRLARRVARADYCAFAVTAIGDGAQLQHGAARLGRRPKAVTTVRPGPGVRVGETSDDDGDYEGGPGDAVFMLDGRRMTVGLRRAFRSSQAITVACGAGESTIRGLQTVVVDPGDRTITVDFGRDASKAAFCLIEDGLSGSDIAVAVMGPPGN